MQKIEKAFFDTGPLLHLYEIKSEAIAQIVKKKFISPEVDRELSKHKIRHKAIIKQLTSTSKDLAKSLQERYNLDLGEAESISLAKQENISLFFTDDLDARLLLI